MDIGTLLVVTIIKSLVMIVALLTAFAYLTFIERRVVARVQVRMGPTHVGPGGLLQPVADAIKMIMKEDIIPERSDKLIYIAAPGIAVAMALVAFAAIPIGPPITIGGQVIGLEVANVNVGLLFTLAILSLGIYGIVLGGWASGNKYSFMGGLRSSAQMISYELALGMSVVGVLLLSGSLNLRTIVEQQQNVWYVVLQPVGFLVFFVCMFAETNRLPFDLAEAETELIAGFHTEYSSIKYALFYMAEYINMVTVSSLAATLFFGGYNGPFFASVIWWFLKIAVFIFIYMWVRSTLPRFRYDQLMRIGWKILLPVSLANVVVTAFIVAIWPMA